MLHDEVTDCGLSFADNMSLQTLISVIIHLEIAFYLICNTFSKSSVCFSTIYLKNYSFLINLKCLYKTLISFTVCFVSKILKLQ